MEGGVKPGKSKAARSVTVTRVGLGADTRMGTRILAAAAAAPPPPSTSEKFGRDEDEVA